MQNALALLAVLFYGLSAAYFSVKFFLKKDRLGTLAFFFLLIGVVTHGLDLLAFGLDHHRFPAANLAEASSVLFWLILLFVMLIVRRDSMDVLGVILIPLAILAILFNDLHRQTEQALHPLLQSGWLYVHIPCMILSIASLTLTCVMAIMYLIQERQLKSHHPSFLYDRLPSLETCENLSNKSLWFGFFMLTLGILTGMVWSKNLRGTYWSWDSKETWSLITWGLYAILIHGRMLSSWRGRKAAYFAILGFVFMLFTIGVSLIFQSYHSF